MDETPCCCIYWRSKLELKPSEEIDELLNILGETMSSPELAKLFVWSFARSRNP